MLFPLLNRVFFSNGDLLHKLKQSPAIASQIACHCPSHHFRNVCLWMFEPWVDQKRYTS